MARIILNEIEQNETMSSTEMGDAKGGWYFYYNVFNRYQNPYGWGMQNSWLRQTRSFDNQHNNFISFLRS